MSKFKINAGGEIETVTPDELRRELRSWFSEVVRGVKFRQASAEGVAAGGVVTFELRGPDEGFMWAVTRMAAAGLGAGEDLQVYRNDVSDSQLIHPALVTVEVFPPASLVLQAGEKLVVTGSIAGRAASLAIGIKEVPITMAWLL